MTRDASAAGGHVRDGGADADGEPVLHGAAGPVALISANAFVFFFGLSWGPVVWVLLGEMFPNRIRAAALSLAAAAQWIANLVDLGLLPRAEGCWARPGLRHLRRLAPCSRALRAALHPRDEGQGARGDDRSRRGGRTRRGESHPAVGRGRG